VPLSTAPLKDAPHQSAVRWGGQIIADTVKQPAREPTSPRSPWRPSSARMALAGGTRPTACRLLLPMAYDTAVTGFRPDFVYSLKSVSYSGAHRRAALQGIMGAVRLNPNGSPATLTPCRTEGAAGPEP
jgi:hypothetical protein